ncbi:alpha/beta fold hydrolase [Vampirovibrio sp.]|uniref:alpha/beta fold hydrolase n=1 Tax=Vampirovibrio sp. TaxID=2717857 RepID=UPI0035938AC2
MKHERQQAQARWGNATRHKGSDLPYFKTNTGSQIYYEHHGRQGPAVLLLHGLASSSRSWRKLSRALQGDYQVYALDFPGHGQSDRWEQYTFYGLSELIKVFMRACGIPKATLVGVSLSCSVALLFAIRYPHKVSGLILAGPLGGYLPAGNPFSWPDRLVFKILPIALQLSVFLLGHHATAYWLNTFGVKRKRTFKSLESIQSQVDMKAVRQLLWQSANSPYVGHLQAVRVNVLIILGQQDPMPRRFVRYIQTHLPHVRLIEIPDSRHLIAMEKPTEFNRLVLDFLSQTLKKQPAASF